MIIIKNDAGIEINLIVNGLPDRERQNILLDHPTKYQDYTHLAYRVESTSIERVVEELRLLGIAVTEGPVELGGGMAVFVRDPDGNACSKLRAGR